MAICNGDCCFGRAGKDGLCDEHRELLALRSLRDAVGKYMDCPGVGLCDEIRAAYELAKEQK